MKWHTAKQVCVYMTQNGRKSVWHNTNMFGPKQIQFAQIKLSLGWAIGMGLVQSVGLGLDMGMGLGGFGLSLSLGFGLRLGISTGMGFLIA